MKKTTALALAVILGVGVLIFMNIAVSRKSSKLAAISDAVGPVGSDVFQKSMVTAKSFYDSYNHAKGLVVAGQYDQAIAELNSCLPHAVLKGETAMVYEQLAGIYKLKGDNKSEMQVLESYIKYTKSEESKDAAFQRIGELKNSQ